MMMKQSRWMMLLAVLICLCMLFASCASGDAGSPDGETPNGPADSNDGKTPDGGSENESTVGNETVVYRAITDEWSKYLEYKAPEADAKKTATLLAKHDGNNLVAYQIGDYIRQIRLVDENTLEAPTYKEYAVCYYSIETGKAVTEEYRYYEYDDSSVFPEKKYSFDCADNVIEVMTYTLTEIEGGGEEYVVTYDYYTKNGEKLNAEALEEPMEDWYLYGVQYPLINYDETYGDYGYVCDQEGILIFNQADGHQTGRYMWDNSYDEEYVDVLANGNLLIRRERVCADVEQLYTLENVGGEKIFYSYVTVDAATGEVKELPVEFVIERLITKKDDLGTNLTLKGDYQYAEITKITDGKLAATVTPVILDNDLKIVAELPLILKNQVSLLQAVTESVWIVELELVDVSYQTEGILYYYTVDLSTGAVNPYVNVGSDMYHWLDGGFVYDGKLYNSLMSPQMELPDGRTDYNVFEGKLYMTVFVEGSQNLKKLIYMDNGYAKTVTIADENDSVNTNYYGYILVYEYDGDGAFDRMVLRDMNGAELISGEYIEFDASYQGADLFVCEDEHGVTSYFSVR